MPLSRRLLGVLVDAALLGAVAALCIWGGVFGQAAAGTDWLEPDEWLPLIQGGGLITVLIGTVALSTLLHGLCHGLTGSSPGKMLLGATVLHAGAPATPKRLAARSAFAGLGALLFFVGPAWILLTPRQRALHDLLTRTQVGPSE
ncbi:MAG: RDD family protein [Myxococcota bacterium]